MKFKLLLITLFFFLKHYSQSVVPFVEVTDSQNKNDILIDCNYPLDADRCFVLKANYTKIKETSSYEVKSIPFTALTDLTQAKTITVSGDDKWSDVVALPFEFCFYNKTYQKIIIGDNGVISFDINKALSDCTYSSATLPNSSTHTNAIFGAFHDMTNVPNVKGCSVGQDCGQIKTYVRGTAPNRSFVVSYEGLNHFNCDKRKSSLQIVIYETSNLIEVYVKDKTLNCEEINTTSSAARRNALIGIQNKDATSAVTPPDRNSGIWTTTNEAWKFVPDGASVTFVKWTDKEGNNLGTGDQIKVCPETTTAYKATVTYDVCVGEDVVLDDTIDVTIAKDFPVAIDNEVIVCDIDFKGEELVDLTQYEKLLLGTQTGLKLSYYKTNTDAKASTNPILTPTNYKLTQSQETFYVRLDRGVACSDIGTLKVNLKETPVSKITKIDVCDVLNDNTEDITLTDYDSQVIGKQTGVTVSYYKSLTDANSKSNSITKITATNGDTVFLRLELTPDSCPNVVEIPIYLLPVPKVKPIKVTLCSDQKIYDLTQHEPDVLTTNAPTNLTFSYHEFESWAKNNTNPFDPKDPKTPIDPRFFKLDLYDSTGKKTGKVQEVWVRSVTTGGCIDVFPVEFTYKEGITLSNNEVLITGTGTIFDLTTAINKMIGSLTGIDVEYYKTNEDAEKRINKITDPKIYAETKPDAKVYVVFVNKASGCTSIGGIGLIPGGGGGGGSGGFGVCDLGNDLKEEVILSNYDQDLLKADDPLKDYKTITYYNTITDANAKANAITNITLTAPKKVYARISTNDIKGSKGVEIKFEVIEVSLNFKTTAKIEKATATICDEFYDNSEIYDLTQLEKDITTNTSAVFKYVEVSDPTKFEVEMPSGKKEQIVNVIVTINGCDLNTTITLSFYPEIILNKDQKFPQCDLDGNTQETFDLSKALSKLTDEPISKFNISYYEADTEGKLSATLISTPNTYLVTKDKTIYVKFEDKVTKCYNTQKLDLEIIPVPQIKKDKLLLCDYQNDNSEKAVDLTQFDATILGGQKNVTVTYFTTQADANSNINAITTTDILGNKQIYVKLSAPDSCDFIGVVNITLQSSPTVKNVDVVVCDNFTDGEERYDLNLSTSNIVSNPSDHTFRYFNSEANAIANSGAVSSNYLIKSVPQTLYVRTINKTTQCFSVSKMNLTFTFPTPVKDTELSACDNDFNLSEEFDLETAIPNMLSNTTGLTITYYTSKKGAETANTSFLVSNPKKYDTKSEDDTVYVRFYSKKTGCFSVGKIILRVLAIPKLVSDIYKICDTDFDGLYTLNLKKLNPIIIKDQTGLTFSYYTSLANAEAKIDPITNITNYNVPMNKHIVYIRVKNTLQCWSVVPVTIEFNKLTSVNNVTDVLESCDDDLDDFTTFDLTSFESKVTSETGATFTYYATEDAAKKQQSSITNPSNYKNTVAKEQIIYVRISVPDKCDAITSFKIATIHIKDPKLKDVSICKGSSITIDLGNQYKSYLWNTSETTQAITVSVAGNYSVTLTDNKGCQGTFSFKVKELVLPTVTPYTVKQCYKSQFKTFDLTDYNSLLTNDTSNIVEYYLSQADLDTGTNKLSSSFTNTTSPQTIYVKVINNLGCHVTTTLTFDIVKFVSVNNVTDVLESCDDDLDDFTIFDLTSFSSKITSEPTASFAYYTSEDDAKKQQLEIPDPTNYKNTKVKGQTIYVRVSAPKQCDVITSFRIATIHIKDPLLLDVSICKGNSVVLDPGSKYNSYVWSTSETTQTIKVSKAGTYSVTLTDNKGCQGTFTVKVTELALPVIVPQVITECSTTSFKKFNLNDYKLSLTDNTSNSVSFYLSKKDLDADVNKLSSSFTNTKNPQTLYVKVKNVSGCETSTTLTLNVVQTPKKPKVVDSLLYNYGEEASPLKAEPDSGNKLIWYEDEFSGVKLSSNPIPSTIAVGSTNYWVSQVNGSGCESKRAKVTVTISTAPITIYNEFSPNGDGINDSFRIEHIEMYPNNKVEIYNRLGTLVFTIDGYINDSYKSFKGQSNVKGEFLGDKLVIGVYFYLIDLGNGTEAKKGWLHINR